MIPLRSLRRLAAPALLLLLGLGVGGCGPDAPSAVQTGADVLAADDFDTLKGQRVGLIVNHTARVDTAHLIDRLHRAPNVEVGALFGPEHGLRGTAAAGEAVTDGVDDRTGAPIYSLYGDTRRPTPEELKGLDALVFDVQDVGARFYTYITTMGLAMQAAADAGLRFVVLDRPNPLGGT
ncbi:MAG: exo-beta-N-acetylmuramidase NamZ domain-containing protein, partial [Salinibacter sp.]